MTHNLDENLGESFEFILDGNKYRMRYPTSTQLRDVLKEANDDLLTDRLLEYITPEEGSPPIKEALEKTNVRKSKRFLKMVREEFTNED